ncbi:zinc transporter 6-A-like [Sycon ciliatum]|uniref:zinc transporter 6-A-like n=1 Tax=Sycon ciliatum TaxID=27933 RepID=UPI0031F6F312
MGFKTALQMFAKDDQSRRALILLGVNLLVCLVMVYWVMASNSLALHTFAFLTFFDILSILTSLLSVWVSQQKPSSTFSFGFERFEVLAIFASTMIILLSGVSIMKQGLERILAPPAVETSRMLFVVLLGLGTHLQVTYGLENKAYHHVATAAGASWLQDAVADMGHSVCSAVPMLRRSLIPQFNPLALVSLTASFAVLVSCLAIDHFGAMTADPIAAMCIAMVVSGTMLPLATYTGRILLQTTPEHVMVQLDKCLREVATLDGVLEIRKEHFWMLSFGTMAGSLHVRIRRDANEQEVLAQVITRLSAVVSHLTIQTFKEDWSIPSSTTTNTIPTNSHSHSHSHTSSSSSGGRAVASQLPLTVTGQATSSTGLAGNRTVGSLQSHVVEFTRQNSGTGPTASFPPILSAGPTASFPAVPAAATFHLPYGAVPTPYLPASASSTSSGSTISSDGMTAAHDPSVQSYFPPAHAQGHLT